MSLIDTLAEEAAELAPAALELIIDLVRGAKSSDDAETYLRRKLEADASHIAAQQAAKKILGG